MISLSPDLISRFHAALLDLEPRFVGIRLEDEHTDTELRAWLDGDSEPLPWSHIDRVTADEWFFVSTLYGEMTLEGQRTHIRKFFPSLFVEAAHRDIRNFIPNMAEFRGLRSAWMRRRFCRMGEILRERGLSMTDYADELRSREAKATPEDPMPALDFIIRDHRATGWKTLSVFVRDCVGGNCFPIDSRVEKELRRHDLPIDERELVHLSLALHRNPRVVARMFYNAGGESP